MHSTSSRSIFVVFPESKNIQRLGSIAALCKVASPSRAIALQDLARAYRNLIMAPVRVPDSERANIITFLNKRNLSRKYKLGGLELVVESQDWLLADPHLPSHTGSEKDDVSATIDLAVQLGLLWASTYQRTWAGDLLASHTDDIAGAFRSGNRSLNPYILSNSQRTVLAALAIENDQTFLGYMFTLLSGFGFDIEIPPLISKVQSTFDGFLKILSTSAIGPEDAKAVAELSQLRNQIIRPTAGRRAAAGGVTVQTLRRTFEELLYWRLESLVDFGYLSKPDPDLYGYRKVEEMTELNDLLKHDFANRFFHHWFTHLGIPNPIAADAARARELLFAANQARCNSMGYTLIREGTLVANLSALQEGRAEVLEYKTSFEALRAGSDERFKVITSVDKNRILSAYKMVKN